MSILIEVKELKKHLKQYRDCYMQWMELVFIFKRVRP